MNELPRTKLRELIATYGPELADQPKRLRSLLGDACPEFKREIYALAAAAEQRVVADLSSTPGPSDWDLIAPRLARRLVDNCAMEDEAARWVVDSWGVALGKVSEAALANSRPPGPDPAVVKRDNLQRWEASGEPKLWVAARGGKWSHDDWERLLASLRQSSYWPMEPSEIGVALERLNSNYRRNPNPPPAPITLVPSSPPPTYSPAPPATPPPPPTPSAGSRWLSWDSDTVGTVLAWLTLGYLILTAIFRPAYPLSGARILGITEEVTGYTYFRTYMGDIYAKGERGAARDEAKALEWYKAASTTKDADAFRKIIAIYETGGSAVQNKTSAIEWQLTLGDLYAEGSRETPRDEPKAVEFYTKAGDGGNLDAQKKLAELYSKGVTGVPRDMKKALEWHRKAGEQGDRYSQFEVGYLLQKGNDGIPQDYPESVKWYQMAADRGDASAQLNLGLAYRYGIGVDKSAEKAMQLFRQSAAQGTTRAERDRRDA